VKEHFADPTTMKPTAEHEKVAGYWNIDNGTGKIRGIYLQGNEMVRPIFEKWLEPFKDMGATTITNRNTGGTDHQSFDGVGLPGFQFIQDTMDYNTRTHHSNMDVYDRIQATDMLQMSAIEASMVYLTAVRPEKLPRKPLPSTAARPVAADGRRRGSPTSYAAGIREKARERPVRVKTAWAKCVPHPAVRALPMIVRRLLPPCVASSRNHLLFDGRHVLR
jgi:hypothetical protein